VSFENKVVECEEKKEEKLIFFLKKKEERWPTIDQLPDYPQLNSFTQ
jgi:hypothetical protein